MDKSEYHIVSGLCCANGYLDTNPKVCGSGEAECLCCASDYVLCGELDYIPRMCSLIHGCVIMPKFGCCKTVDHYFPGEAALAKKKDRTVCDATCCGGCYYETTYLKPFDCACRSTSRMCCCLVSEFALPCADDVPKTFVLYGLMLYPKVGCCVKVKDVMPAQVAPAAEKEGGAPPAAEAGAGAVAAEAMGERGAADLAEAE